MCLVVTGYFKVALILQVQFRSDDSVTSLGFAAMYSAKAEQGGRNANNNSGGGLVAVGITVVLHGS